MLRDFKEFLFALWAEWKVLLTGGSILAILNIATTAMRKPPSKAVNWIVLGATLVLAAFFAWRKEWILNGSGFITLSPKELANLAKGEMTGVHLNLRVYPYLHKWIRVTGKLGDVSQRGLGWGVYIMLRGDGGTTVNASVNNWKARPFIPLSAGTLVTVAGRIKTISYNCVTLESMEFVKIEPDQTSDT